LISTSPPSLIIFKAIPKSTPAETDTIVKDILLKLPSFEQSTSKRDELLRALLAKAKVCFGRERGQNKPITIKDTRFYLDLAAFVVTRPPTTSATTLLQFYCDYLLNNATLQKLYEDDQLSVVYGAADTLVTCNADIRERNVTPDEFPNLQLQVMKFLPTLLEAS
jgi:hypothetical protein